MNKNIIKNFALQARKSLINEISDKLFLIGISRDEIKENISDDSNFCEYEIGKFKTYKIYGDDIKNREILVKMIRKKGFDFVVEEVAYTWFNRIIAIRFMEVNGYLPSGIRVLSSINKDKLEPDIITYFEELDFLTDKEYIYELRKANKVDELFKYLFIEQSNSLNKILPALFRKTNTYINLLFPANLSNKNSFIRKIVNDIDETYFYDNVEIIGWLYQYYIIEKKDEVFKNLKQNIRISKENIPSVTQIFTPKWIVKYMVENSLGKFYIENNRNFELNLEMDYFVNADFYSEKVFEGISPESIKIIDPCMGSGHILVYAFDLLFEIYKQNGYLEFEIPYLIFENNLFGIDIDDRAYELAYFALMMKGRSKNRKFFYRENLKFNLYSIVESNEIYDSVFEKIKVLDVESQQSIIYLLDLFKNSKEYGSLISVKKLNYDFEDKLYKILSERELDLITKIIKTSKILSDKYHVVVTNPPYMSSRGMSKNLISYLNLHYPNSKMDLFSVFIERGFELTLENGYNVMLTMQSWMFLSKFEKLRRIIFKDNTIISLLHMDNNVMSIAFGTSATIFKKKFIDDYDGIYNYVKYEDLNEDGELLNISCAKRFKVSLNSFNDICGVPLNYWISDRARKIFKEYKSLKEYFEPKQGMATTDNKKFIRYWYEIDKGNIEFECRSHDELKYINKKWFPYNKGGDYRKWYGNNEYIIKYENSGKDLIEFVKGKYPNITDPEFVIKNRKFYFRKGITWSLFGFKNFGVRFKDYGFIFDVSGSSLFPNEKYEKYILAFLCSKVCFYFLSSIAPTVNFQIGNIGDLPIIIDDFYLEEINELANRNIYLCKKEWNFYETSWDFKIHPAILFKISSKIEDSFKNFKMEVNNIFFEVKQNEEKINRIFKNIYGFDDEVSEILEDKDVSIREVNEKNFVESFISYFVGCVFGRYSLDYEGVVEHTDDIFKREYKKFYPNVDNLIVISEHDYFKDDVYNLFLKFLGNIFGQEHLNENLNFICKALSINKNINYRENIVQYFLKGFFKTHMKTYNKRPIYLEFCSGKNNGINAITYFHRFSKYDILKFKSKYLDIIEQKYENEVLRFENVHDDKKVLSLKKQKEDLIIKLDECKKYKELILFAFENVPEMELEDGIIDNYEKLQNIKLLKSQTLFK